MKYRFLSLALVAALFSACDKKAADTPATETPGPLPTEELSASELVHNPNTANAQEIKSDGRMPVMTFDKPEYDFGTAREGDVVSHVYQFKNTGNAPLIIENASASCGCTVPEYPRNPIAPGESGKIAVKFDTKGKFGQQSKQVTIRANTQPNITTLTIKGNIPGGPGMGPVRQ